MINDGSIEKSSAERSFHHLAQAIQSDLSAARSTAADLENELQSFVRERPIAAVLTALCVGFAVARIFARR